MLKAQASVLLEPDDDTFTLIPESDSEDVNELWQIVARDYDIEDEIDIK